MGHELHRDSRLVIYTVDADARPVVALDTVDISLDRLSDADFKKAQALIEDIRHPGALKALVPGTREQRQRRQSRLCRQARQQQCGR